MKEAFKTHNFRNDTLATIEGINGILDDYAAQGYDLTLRQIYYRLVALDLFPDDRRWRLIEGTNKWVRDPNGTKNALPNYKWLGDIISDARLAGLIDWDMIVDRGRRTERALYWDSPAAIIRMAANQFALNKWKDQPAHIEVMVEKQALEGVLIPVCEELDVSFTSNKGYSSQSFMYRKAKEVGDHYHEGKEIHILYVGDHDPSGLDMDRDILERLSLFNYYEKGETDFRFRRLALTWDQVNEFNFPPNPAKVTDSRAVKYIKEHGDESWELDAIEPRMLAKLVTDAVLEIRDDSLWEAALEREAEEREKLLDWADNYQE